MPVENKTTSKFSKTSTTYRKKAMATLVNTGCVDLEYFKNKVVDQLERLEMLADRGGDFENHRQSARDVIYSELQTLYEMDGLPEATCGDPLEDNLSEEEIL